MKLVLSFLLLGLCTAPLFAQIYTQDNIIVQDEALLYVQGGGLHFATGSTLENRGTVKLAGNWRNNATANLLLGKGKIIFPTK